MTEKHVQALSISKVSLRKQNLSMSGVRPLRTPPEVALLGMIWASGITLQSLVEARGLVPFVLYSIHVIKLKCRSKNVTEIFRNALHNVSIVYLREVLIRRQTSSGLLISFKLAVL